MRLRFTIRDLLWLTLVAAVLVAWWLDRSRLQSKVNEFEAWEAHSGGGAF